MRRIVWTSSSELHYRFLKSADAGFTINSQGYDQMIRLKMKLYTLAKIFWDLVLTEDQRNFISSAFDNFKSKFYQKISDYFFKEENDQALTHINGHELETEEAKEFFV